MGYIGRGPAKSGAFRLIDSIASSFDGSTTAFTLQSSSSNITPGTEQNLLIAVDGVMQEPVDAFTISGSTITFTSAPASNASFWGVELGDVGGIAQTVANGTVDTAQLVDDAVTAAKLANSINTEITANTAKVTNATHTGDVTGATALTIAAGAVDIAHLSASGSAGSGTFLRGDNQWQAAGGGKVVQNVFVHQGQRITGTTTVPDDDTPPQNDEGVEMMTLAITPKATNNRLLINAQAMWSHSSTGMMAMSLFQDSIAAALTTAVHRHSATNTLYSTTLFWEMAAGTTSATTFKIRMGSNASGNMNMNGTTGRLYGAILCSHITIMELEPNS